MPNFSDTNVEKKTAQWQLTGSAYIFVYYFSKKFLQTFKPYLADYQLENWKGGLGSIMLVKYDSSDVGPYHELLFIPGSIELAGHKGFSIAHITVSTMESVLNGIENWAIPKKLANFDWEEVDKTTDKISIELEGVRYFEIEVEKSSFKFPMTTAILPLNIIQKQNDKIYVTKPAATGKASFASLKSLYIDNKYMPDLSNCKPLVSLALHNFRMVFPVAQIIES